MESNTLVSKTNELLKNLDPSSIKDLLDFIISSKPLTNEQNEVDLQCIFMAALYMNTAYDVGAGKHAGNNRNMQIDVKVIVKKKFILIFELKVICAGWEKACTQRLHMSVRNDLKLLTLKRGDKYPSAGLANLSKLSRDQLFGLGVNYTNAGKRYYTVGQVHDSAKSQACEYAKFQEKAQPLPVIAFAITMVLNRVIVDEVHDGRPAPAAAAATPAVRVSSDVSTFICHCFVCMCVSAHEVRHLLKHYSNLLTIRRSLLSLLLLLLLP